MWIIVVARVQRRSGLPVDGAAHHLLLAPAHHPRLLRPRRRQAGRAALRSAGSTTTASSRWCRPPTTASGKGCASSWPRSNPKVIGINESETFNHADGITANEKDNLLKALGPTEFAPRVKSAEMLAVGWLERQASRRARGLPPRDAGRRIRSSAKRSRTRSSSPGVTTTEDVVWWMRQRVAEMGLGGWFHPSITIWRKGGPHECQRRASIQPRRHAPHRLRHRLRGLLHRHAAPRLCAAPGETDAPQGLKDGLKAANRLQDLTMQFAKVGGTGNQALADARAAGDAGRASCPRSTATPSATTATRAGPPIGMTDYQEGVPVRGDYAFRAEHLALDRTERHPQGAGVGRISRSASRSRRTPFLFSTGLAMGGRPADRVLPDQVRVPGSCSPPPSLASACSSPTPAARRKGRPGPIRASPTFTGRTTRRTITS